MRYREVETLTFTNARGRSARVKGLREIPSQRTRSTVRRQAHEPFDMVAARRDVFGEGGERFAWRLHDAEAVMIVERLFDYSHIRTVRVPE